MASDTRDRQGSSEAAASDSQDAEGAVTDGRGGFEGDLFDAIAAQFFSQVQMITAPGALDARWPGLIAQAYREGIMAFAAQAPGGMLFQVLPDGSMALVALGAGTTIEPK